jgi:hydrogenase/urease accessory protein HupE
MNVRSRLRRSCLVRGAVLAALLLLGPGLAGAHPLAPSLLDLREAAATSGGRITALWRRPQLLRVGVRLEPVLPGRCRTIEPPVETSEGAAEVTRWTVDCGPAGLSGGTVAVRGLAEAGSDALLRVELADGRRVQAVLRAAAPSFVLPSEQGAAGVAAGYLTLGIGHLLTGWDHLAFVLSLVLLIGGWRQLLGTVTAFTLGHSLTLSLAALGLVRLPTGPIEVAIALSILALAVELARRDRPTLFGRRPWLMAAGFGLLHGLGFAGALAAVGLPVREIPLALLAFNVGIELAQIGFILAVLGLAFALAPLLRRLPAWTAAVPTYLIGTLAAFWMFQRLAGL